jgi:hypothetical protein
MCPADGRVGNVVTVVMVLADIPIAPTGIYAYLFRHQRPGLPFGFFLKFYTSIKSPSNKDSVKIMFI